MAPTKGDRGVRGGSISGNSKLSLGNYHIWGCFTIDIA